MQTEDNKLIHNDTAEKVFKHNIKHYTREEIMALQPVTVQEDYGQSRTQITIDGERYDKLTVFLELVEAVAFKSFFKGCAVGFGLCLVLSLLVGQ